MGIKYDEKFIKEPGLEQEYTKDQITNLVKCSKDLFYFLNFVTIVTLDGGRKKLGDLLYPFQKDILDLFSNNRYCIVLSGRQQGKSTMLGAYVLWYSIFNKDKFVGIASNKASSSKDILRRIKIMYEELPYWLKPGVVEYNKNSIEFENGSRLETSATTEDSFRGRSINLLCLDEFSFIQDSVAREFYGSVYPAISASEESKLFIISTPNGILNLYHQIYSGAEKGTNKFKHIKVPWYKVPGRNEAWKEIQLKNIGEQKFSQEYDCQFLGSSNTVIHKDAIAYMETTVCDPIKLDLMDRLRIYEYPEDGCKYIMAVDPSKGTGQHDATIQIYKIESYIPARLVNVATFQSNTTETYKLSSIINKLCIYYNSATIFCENNGEGSTISQNLWWVYENPNLYNSGQRDNEIGIRATKSTKPHAIITMKKLIDGGNLIIKDRATAKQLSTYIEDEKGKFSTVDGKDDLISALYWLAFGTTTEIFNDDFNLLKQFNDNEDQIWGVLSDIDEYEFANNEWDF